MSLHISSRLVWPIYHHAKRFHTRMKSDQTTSNETSNIMIAVLSCQVPCDENDYFWPRPYQIMSIFTQQPSYQGCLCLNSITERTMDHEWNEVDSHSVWNHTLYPSFLVKSHSASTTN